MDLESTKLQLEDEIEAKVELQKLLIKIQEETRILRDRLERELEGKNEEIEDQRFWSFFLTKMHLFFLFFRRKFNGRINEVQEQLTEVLAKASQLEKTKQRLQGELDKLNGDVEKVKSLFEIIQKTQIQYFLVP
jgi:predicted nuclease with TOPRIM domain